MMFLTYAVHAAGSLALSKCVCKCADTLYQTEKTCTPYFTKCPTTDPAAAADLVKALKDEVAVLAKYCPQLPAGATVKAALASASPPSKCPVCPCKYPPPLKATYKACPAGVYPCPKGKTSYYCAAKGTSTSSSAVKTCSSSPFPSSSCG
jgi:hypothetical protein